MAIWQMSVLVIYYTEKDDKLSVRLVPRYANESG
jgi:hypothetical protein